MDIHVEMHLSYETDVWAYGMVTLENIIRFPVQLRKFKNKDTGEETSFLSYPRRERCGKWENILVPEKKLREEIEKAVGEKIKEEMRKDLYLPEIEILSISPIVPRYPPNAKAYICGVASVQLLGLQQLQEDLKCYQSYQIKNQDRFEMIIENVTFDDKELAGKTIRTAAKKENRLGESGEIGTYQGFTMFVSYNHISNSYNLKLQNQRSYLIELGENGLGNIIRINNALDNIPKHIARAKQNLQTYESQLEDAKIEVMKEFPKEADLKEKTDRLSELNALLNMDQSNHEIVAEEQIEEQETAEVTNKTQKNEVVPKFGTR